MSTQQEILDAISELASEAHINIHGSADGETVEVLVRFEPGNKEQYIDAENVCNRILNLVPVRRPGSRWGTDSASVGGSIGLEGGYCRLTQSGVDRRIAKALHKLETGLQYADVWSGASAKAAVTAGTQKRRTKAEKAAKVQAEATVGAAVAEAVERTRKRKPVACTAEQIVAERDGKGLSWKQVAINLDLGSPGAARRAYTELTGKPHNESQPLLKRAPRNTSGAPARKVDRPDWNDETDQQMITDRLQGEWIPPKGEPGTKNFQPGHWQGSNVTVERKLRGTDRTYEETVRVRRVVEFSFGKDGNQPLQITVVDDYSGATRCFFVADIADVR